MLLPTARAVSYYASTPSYRADTTAWLGVAAGSYSTPERQALDTYLGSLDSGGLLTFDRLYLGQFADTLADSLICIVSRQVATAVTSPVFTRRQGWTGSASTGAYINTNWVVSSGVNYQVSSRTVGCYVRQWNAPTNVFRAAMGASDINTTNNALIAAGANDANSLFRVNTGSGNTTPTSLIPSAGAYCEASRLSSVEYFGRKNSTSETIAVASAGRTGRTMFLLARNFNGTRDGQGNHQLSMAWMGAGRTQEQYNSFRSITDTFHTAIGFS